MIIFTAKYLKILLLFTLVVLAGVFSINDVFGQSIPPLNLSNNNSVTGTHNIAHSGNNVYVVWMDNFPGNYDIYFKKSTDNGATFGSVVNLSNSAGWTSMPTISASGNNVYVVWHDGVSGDYNEIFFVRSTDNGATFSSPVNLSNSAESSDNPQISASGTNVYITWQEKISRSSNGGNSEIFFVRSTDGGSTFSSTINVSNTSSWSSSFQMKTLENNIYVVWRDTTDIVTGGIYFAKSTDNGNTFSSPQNVNNISGYSDYPYVDVSGNNVYVTWTTEPTGKANQAYFAKSTDNGNTFSSPINLSKNPTDTRSMQISASGNNIYVLMNDNNFPASGGDEDVYFTKSTNRGDTFSTPITLSNTRPSTSPMMVVSGSIIYAVWSNNSPSDIFLVKSTDSGNSFSTPINLSNTSTPSGGPLLDLSGNNLYVAWLEIFSNQSNDVFFTVVSTQPDTIPPVVIVPQNMIVNLNSTSVIPTPVTFSFTATDNVGVVTQSCTPASGSAFPIGVTTVTCTATDKAGNTATKSFTVTVNKFIPKDTDGDGIPDSSDSCPTQPETVNNYQDTDGCPDVVPSTYADAATVEMAKGSGSNTNCADKCYTPSTVQIKIGGTVTWKNVDTTAHTVTSGKDATSDGIFDSGMIMVGNSFDYKFNREGTYPYYDMVHPWMKGIILVGGGTYIPPTDTDGVPDSVLTLNSIPDKTIEEKKTLVFTPTLTESLTGLIFSLEKNPPTGASINSETGKFKWTPTESQGPASYVFDIVVKKGALEDRESVKIIVTEPKTIPESKPTPEEKKIDDAKKLDAKKALDDKKALDAKKISDAKKLADKKALDAKKIADAKKAEKIKLAKEKAKERAKEKAKANAEKKSK